MNYILIDESGCVYNIEAVSMLEAITHDDSMYDIVLCVRMDNLEAMHDLLLDLMGQLSAIKGSLISEDEYKAKSEILFKMPTVRKKSSDYAVLSLDFGHITCGNLDEQEIISVPISSLSLEETIELHNYIFT